MVKLWYYIRKDGDNMVKFTNVQFDLEWIYADAYDADHKVSGHIKVHRHKGLFFTDCKSNNQFQRAVWALVKDVNKGKILAGGARTVAWG